MIDDEKTVILVLLDLSTVFDTIDHNLLLSCMMTQLGIDENVLTWLKSYLSCRGQRVRIGDAFSLVATVLFIAIHSTFIIHNFNESRHIWDVEKEDA